MKLFNLSSWSARKVVWLAVAVIVVLAAGVFIAYKISQPNLIKQAEVALSAEERQTAQQQLAEAEEAISNFTEDTAPGNKVDPYFEKGQALYILGKYAQAKTALEEAIKMDAGRRDIWFAKFRVERAMQDYESAEKSMQAALFINDKVAEYWKEYIEMKRDNMNTPNLEELYTESLFKTNFDVSLVRSYAQHKEKMGDLGGALNAWRIAQQKDPENEEIRLEIERLEELVSQMNF